MRIRSPTGLARRSVAQTGIGFRFALAFAALPVVVAAACGEIGGVESEDPVDGDAQVDSTDSQTTSAPPEETAAESSEFKDLVAGSGHTCGLRTDDTVVCWGANESGQADAPAGKFTAISASLFHSCGLRTDGAIECWGDYPQVYVPEGQFTAVATGQSHTCGLRTDSTIECRPQEAWFHPPVGLFSEITAKQHHSCGLRTDGTIKCWGPGSHDAPPDGRFDAVAISGGHACALRIDGTVTCWRVSTGRTHPEPSGHFRAISAGDGHFCGLRTDGTAACWGLDYHGEARAPSGQLLAVAAGGQHSCGLRSDRTIVCWGKVLPDGLSGGVAQPPLGVTIDDGSGVADASMCRPRGPQMTHTAGFPLPLWAGPATGTLRMAVLFVDFPDAVAGHTTEQEAELGLPFMEGYIESSSYGKLDLEFVHLHRWLRATRSHEDYMRFNAAGGFRSTGRGVAEEAIALADPHFDFADVDAAMIVLPSSHFGRGEGGSSRSFSTSEGTLGPVYYVNSGPVDADSTGNGEWGTTATHEFLHALGLLDHYPYSAPRNPRRVQFEGMLIDFGAMGLRAFAPYDPGDQAISDRSTPGFEYRDAPEILAWSRWQLGWLDDTQIECVTGDEASVTLGPVADPGDHTAMVTVPLSDTEVIVVESRRSVGFDSGDALAHEGVLIYTVDAAVHTGLLPIKLAGTTGNTHLGYDILDGYPVLAAGERITLRGYEIAVVADDGATHTVAISRIGGE